MSKTPIEQIEEHLRAIRELSKEHGFCYAYWMESPDMDHAKVSIGFDEIGDVSQDMMPILEHIALFFDLGQMVLDDV